MPTPTNSDHTAASFYTRCQIFDSLRVTMHGGFGYGLSFRFIKSLLKRQLLRLFSRTTVEFDAHMEDLFPVEEELIYYDGPMLWLGRMKNTNHWHLVVCAEIRDSTHLVERVYTWLAAPLSPGEVEALKQERLTLRDAFTKHQVAYVFKAEFDTGTKKLTLTNLAVADLEERHLPDRGLFLHRDRDEPTST